MKESKVLQDCNAHVSFLKRQASMVK